MAEKENVVSEKTKLVMPIGWVFTLLVGCASFTTVALKVGQYVGGNDANATAIVQRVSAVEQRVDVLERLDGRLARIEGKLGIYAGETLRAPAAK